MPDKKTLMTCETSEFLASMNPKRECKRKSAPTMRSQKNHQKKSKHN